MAGLEVLYTCVGRSVTCPQDAVVCFVHWEMIKRGFRCIGSGDEVKETPRDPQRPPVNCADERESGLAESSHLSNTAQRKGIMTVTR